MDKFILSGKHLIAVLQAAEYMLESEQRLEDVELIFSNTEKLYVLRTKAGRVLETFPS